MKTEKFIIKTDQPIYDYIVVGAGITGATVANTLACMGFTVAVFETRDHVAGTCYTQRTNGIDVHMFGAHIFRTESKDVWDYVNQFHSFHPFNHKVMVEYKGEQFSFPINYTTLRQVFPAEEIKTPADAYRVLQEEISKVWVDNPKNLEEQAKNLVGEKLYKFFVKGYTEKQWGRKCSELPPEIIKRIPVRFLADDNYFPAEKKYQGIPDAGGYTKLVKEMLTHDNITVFLGCKKDDFKYALYKYLIFYSGAIDELCDYKYGALGWRSLEFKTKRVPVTYYQPTPVVNYTSVDVPFTRIIEHKHFDILGNTAPPICTIITKEYPKEWKDGDEKYYPINDTENEQKYHKYLALLDDMGYRDIVPCGRLGKYKYYDMDVAISEALKLVHYYTSVGC